MSSRQFVRWMAYYTLEPWGDLRSDSRSMFLAMASLAPYRKNSSSLNTKAFFPHLSRRETAQQSDEDMMLLAMQWTTAKGGRIVKGGK